LLKDQSRVDVHFQRDLPAASGGERWPNGLSGFAVSSNTQAMLHSEHMLDLGGAIQLRPGRNGWDVVNNSELDLKDAAVIGPDGVAWIGDLAPRRSATLDFRDPERDKLTEELTKALNSATPVPDDVWVAQREKSPTTARRSSPDVLNIRQLVRLAQNHTPDGEIRLVAWTADELPGLRIRPEASQSRHANLVIARLQHVPDNPPRQDKKTRAEVEKEDPTEEKKAPEQP
jgi:hypothetical protein